MDGARQGGRVPGGGRPMGSAVSWRPLRTVRRASTLHRFPMVLLRASKNFWEVSRRSLGSSCAVVARLGAEGGPCHRMPERPEVDSDIAPGGRVCIVFVADPWMTLLFFRAGCTNRWVCRLQPGATTVFGCTSQPQELGPFADFSRQLHEPRGSSTAARGDEGGQIRSWVARASRRIQAAARASCTVYLAPPPLRPRLACSSFLPLLLTCRALCFLGLSSVVVDVRCSEAF